jgi:hypothetical protein
VRADAYTTRSPDAWDTYAGEGSQQTNIQISFGKETLAVILLLAVIIGICGLIMGLNLSKQDRQDQDFRDMKTQQWLVERRLMDREALDILHGDKLPSDTEFGPTGNLQRMKPKEK